MDPVTLVFVLWFVATFLLLLIKYVVEETVAGIRGHTSPRIARRAARKQLTYEYGTPSVGTALLTRLTHRIENPPQRRWAAQLRALLTELAEDAITETRVRHEQNQRARARRRARQAGWRVRTGGGVPTPPPPPDPPDEDDGVLDTYPCAAGCGTGHVTEPGEQCDACEQAAAPPPPEDTPPADDDPADQAGDDTPPDRSDDMAKSATHQIDGDVRDPRTALAFATACREMNDGVARELDVLAANMQRQELGATPLGEIRVLADAARRYSASSQKSVEAYAEHVVIQADLSGDDDLKGTVRRTYLDTRGAGDAAPAPKGKGKTRTISAADIDTPAAAARFMDTVAATYVTLQASVDQAKGKHEQQGVSDEPVAFLAEQLEFATTLAQQAKRSAATFRAHVQKRDDTVGKNKSVSGTQTGRYMDTKKA